MPLERPGPYDNVRAGTMLFTLVDPHPGHEVTYNRWYERDHFYAGCLIGKGWFAGRRWVAPKALKDLRFPTETPFLEDVTAGSYLATYWIQKGEDAAAITWGSEQVRWLHENDRMYAERDHVHTLMYVLRWSSSRDEDGVPTALALDHPFRGLVAVMVDRDEDVDAREFSDWVRDEAVPAAIAGSSTALVVGTTPIPLPEGAPVFQPANPGHERRMLLLGFLDGEPAEGLAPYRALADALAASGRGTVSYVAPFLPTIPGTDTYTDQLW
jgi:hypothetical protein